MSVGCEKDGTARKAPCHDGMGTGVMSVSTPYSSFHRTRGAVESSRQGMGVVSAGCGKDGTARKAPCHDGMGTG